MVIKMQSNAISVEKPTQDKIGDLNVKSWSIWESEAKTFDWHYDENEIFYVLEGKVKVTTSDGQEVEFGSGDLVTFPAGMDCTWTVIEPIRKHYRMG